MLSPGTGAAYAGLLFPVRGAKAYHAGKGPPEKVEIRAPDDRTLSVTLDRPIPYFPSLTAFFTLLPVPRHTVEKHGDRWTRPENMVGNGPFVLKSWRFYREIVLQRNPTHRTRPGVDRIRLLPIVDANTQFNLYSTGVADVTFSVPDPIVHRLAGRPDFVTGPRLSTSFIRLNVRRKPLDNQIFRHAIALAIDRDAITSRVTRGGETPTRSLVPPVLPGYDPHPGLVGGAKIARHTLEIAGVGKVRPLTILLPENPDYAVLAGVVAHQLKETLGLEVRLDIREWKVYLAARRRGDYDLALSRWIGDYPDPTTFLDCFRSGDGNNQTGFADATYDRLLAEAADSATDRRSETLRAAEGRLLALAPIVPLFHPTTRFMVSERVRGFRPNVMGIVRFADLSVGDR